MQTGKNPSIIVGAVAVTLVALIGIATQIRTKYAPITDDETIGEQVLEQFYAAFHHYRSTGERVNPNISDEQSRNAFLKKYGSTHLHQILTSSTKGSYWISPVYNPHLNDPQYGLDKDECIVFTPVYTHTDTGPSINHYVVLMSEGHIMRISLEEWATTRELYEDWPRSLPSE